MFDNDDLYMNDLVCSYSKLCLTKFQLGYTELWLYRTLVISNFGYIEPWLYRTLVTSNLGYIEFWLHRTLFISNFGYIELFSCINLFCP